MNMLEKILAVKLDEVSRLKTASRAASLHEQALGAPAPLDFLAALRRCPHVPVVAEIKRSSPSLGKIRNVKDVGPLAKSFEQAGASALSVLTDGVFFGGGFDDLREARAAATIPILCKEFILDPVQIWEARVAGADAVLLIVAALSATQLGDLFMAIRGLGMTPIVETHNESEVQAALDLKPPIIGVNSRDLKTLGVDLGVCERLRLMIPPDILVLGESGIKDAHDVARLRRAGVNAFLIGSTLMQASDPAATLARLCRVSQSDG
jgi:indole-3-glycerol phosphate synthase